MSRSLSLLAVLVLVVASCGGGSSHPSPDAMGTVPGTGGSGSGGATGTAGATRTGGTTGTGGATGTGGTTKTGGATGTAGATSTGGTTITTSATGTGGTTGTGGATGAGGSTMVDAGPDAGASDVIVLPVDSEAADVVVNRDVAGPEAATIKDPYFTTTEESDGMHAWYLPWADRSAGPTDMSGMNSSQEVVPLTIGTDGHIYRNGARYRLFGINVYGDCSPPRETADILAARMSKVGFNALHAQACDWFSDGPGARSLIDYSKGNGDTLDKERLDRFDYWVAALRKRGIYLVLPLLNTRRFLPGDSGDPANPLPLPPITAGETWNSDDIERHQHLGLILDSVVAAQQRYARNLLTHVNPYTGLALAKDPALAVVTMVYETGLIHYWMFQRLDALDNRILAELRRKWNAWLAAKYTTTAGLNTAWAGTATTTELLRNTGLATPLSPWRLQVQSPAVATATTDPTADNGNPALRIDITTASTASWHVQLNQGGVPLVPGQSYRISFRAKATSTRALDVDVLSDGEPVTPYMQRKATLGTDWQDFSMSFLMGDNVANPTVAFLGFEVGIETGSVWIAKPSLTTGGPVLDAGETLETNTIPLVPRASSRPFPRPAVLDYIRFLRDMEVSYFKRMSDFLKKDLGVSAHLVGSQIINSPPTVQAAMDIIDTHSAWEGPGFVPGKPYDRESWVINNQSAVYSPPGLIDIVASARVAGKPLFSTETSYSHPNEYAGEGPLLTAAYGSLQDIDAFFQHEWGWSGQYDSTAILDWFDTSHHPPKLISSALAARLFRSFDVTPAKQVFTAAMDPDRELEALMNKGKAWRVADASTRGFPMAAAAISRVEMNVASGATDSAWPDVSTTTKFLSDTGELSWDKTAGMVTINSAKTRAVVGFSNNKSFSLGGPGIDCDLASGPCVTFAPGKTITGHSTIHLQLTEGDSFTTGAGRALLSATGTVRNTDMQWNAAKTTATWGRAPTRVELIAANVTLPRAATEVAVYALDGRGQRIAKVPVTGTTAATFAIGGTVPTLWYEVVLGAATAKGEGNKLLDACGGYCASVTASLPTCYASTNDCLEDCAGWTGDTLGGRCDCTAEVDALFACEKTNTTRICGRLSQGVPPSNACLPAFVQAFKCSGKVAPCTANLTEELADDFEDGDLRGSHAVFSSWKLESDASTTVTPSPFAASVHGANGSGKAAHLTATLSSGYLNFSLPAAQPAGVDLSGYAGIAFSARGLGKLRVVVATTDLEGAGNYDAYGKTLVLTSNWRRYVIRFDSPDFAQDGFGAKAPFTSSKVSRLAFGSYGAGPLDFWVDDVVLLKAN